MKLTIKQVNCNNDLPYIINESADSCIELHMEFDRIITKQSRKPLLDELKNNIHSELKKIKWLISGKVQLDIIWFLDSVKRQETDKIGDLDNMTKPLIDCLSGQDGIIIDDSQLNSITSSWGTRSLLNIGNLVIMTLSFNNNYTVNKENLYFLEVSTAIYTPLNIDINSTEDLKEKKLYLEGVKHRRKSAENFKNMGANVDRYLIYSEWKFHRTRLNGFSNNIILDEKKFKEICIKHNI